MFSRINVHVDIQPPVILSSLCKWKRPKWLFYVVKRYAVREAKKMAVRSTQCKNRAVRSTQRGGGVTLIDSAMSECVGLGKQIVCVLLHRPLVFVL